MSQRKPTSCWQRHSKVKRRYSAAYHTWREAVERGGEGAVAKAAHAHSRFIESLFGRMDPWFYGDHAHD